MNEKKDIMSEKRFMVCVRSLIYNHEKYINDLLHGLMMQEVNFPVVLLLEDDASTDNTQQILHDYVVENFDTENKSVARVIDFEGATTIFAQHKTKPNIYVAYVQMKYNHFGKFSRDPYNSEWRSSAKYEALCDGDDYWTDPLKLQKQVDFLETHEDTGLCVTDFCYQKDFGTLSQPAFANGLFIPENFEQHLINSGYIAPMTWLYRRSIYEKFILEKNLTDATFAIALNLYALSKVAYLDDVTAVYRSHVGSATMQVDPKKAFLYSKGVFQTQLDYAKKYNCDAKMVRNLKIQGYIGLIHEALEADDKSFVQEALDFYRSEGMEMKWLIEECKRYVEYHRQYRMISHSKAYRLGTMLLKPFKWLRK